MNHENSYTQLLYIILGAIMILSGILTGMTMSVFQHDLPAGQQIPVLNDTVSDTMGALHV